MFLERAEEHVGVQSPSEQLQPSRGELGVQPGGGGILRRGGPADGPGMRTRRDRGVDAQVVHQQGRHQVALHHGAGQRAHQAQMDRDGGEGDGDVDGDESGPTQGGACEPGRDGRYGRREPEPESRLQQPRRQHGRERSPVAH